mmetsp:Transcript_68579/g.162646  ORF Transcript_68579/g.162646 Transcript_68579/m.162646 type:complete len:240 (-) Transcript_68579:187-906(-)
MVVGQDHFLRRRENQPIHDLAWIRPRGFGALGPVRHVLLFRQYHLLHCRVWGCGRDKQRGDAFLHVPLLSLGARVRHPPRRGSRRARARACIQPEQRERDVTNRGVSAREKRAVRSRTRYRALGRLPAQPDARPSCLRNGDAGSPGTAERTAECAPARRPPRRRRALPDRERTPREIPPRSLLVHDHGDLLGVHADWVAEPPCGSPVHHHRRHCHLRGRRRLPLLTPSRNGIRRIRATR